LLADARYSKASLLADWLAVGGLFIRGWVFRK